MVYFVGAGPGAEDLITLRGARLLENADLIIFAGSLINTNLLNLAKGSCKLYDSAKMTLEEVIETMLKEHEDISLEKIVVRLHSGDPSMYGAINEQMRLLDEHKIKYSVVPGVSSFCGAAAALNVEYTLPGVSQTVILTRMEGRTPVPQDEEITKLASHKSSMVLFLTSSMIGLLGKKLVKGGYSPETPAAIVYKATWPDEKVIKTTIKDLGKEAKANNISKTSLILIGDFLSGNGEKSKLYDGSFTHEYRGANKK